MHKEVPIHHQVDGQEAVDLDTVCGGILYL